MNKIAIVGFVVTLMMSSFAAGKLYDSLPAMSDKDIAEEQISQLVFKAQMTYAMVTDFGQGNILPVLSGGQEGEFKGFLPYVAPTTSVSKEANRRHNDAMKGLWFSEEGSRLESGVLGEITVTAKGETLEIGFPECPVDVCTKQSIKVAKR